MDDAAELDWWRKVFATRFPGGSLPKPGAPLLGRRFRLVDVNEDISADDNLNRLVLAHDAAHELFQHMKPNERDDWRVAKLAAALGLTGDL